eukprot:8778143-Prorocentrum_lima.AAC.1
MAGWHRRDVQPNGARMAAARPLYFDIVDYLRVGDDGQSKLVTGSASPTSTCGSCGHPVALNPERGTLWASSRGRLRAP